METEVKSINSCLSRAEIDSLCIYDNAPCVELKLLLDFPNTARSYEFSISKKLWLFHSFREKSEKFAKIRYFHWFPQT